MVDGFRAVSRWLAGMAKARSRPWTLSLLPLFVIVFAYPGDRLLAAASEPFRPVDFAPEVKAVSGQATSAKFASCRVSTCEPASTTSQFIDSIGVNVPTADARTFDGMLHLLEEAGIRHVRVGICRTVVECSFFKHLHQAGIKGTVIEGADTTANQLSELLTRDGPLTEGGFVEALEGVNEPNNPGMPWYTPQWAVHTRSQQQALWRTVKGNPATAHVSVLGPSICCNDVDQRKLGDLSGFLDFGNMHDYFGVQNPGAIFYTGAYVIDHQMSVQSAISGKKPIISTETGWGTREGRPRNDVSDIVQEKYVLRGFLEHRLHHVARVFDFLLVDDASAGPDFASYGLVAVTPTASLQPKPSFAAVGHLIAELTDRGPPFQPTGLSFSIGGDGASVDHLLLQKSDGSFDLILWAEVPGWDAQDHRAISYAPQEVRLAFSTPIGSAERLDFDPQHSGRVTVSKLAVGTHGIDVTVTDMPEIIHLIPTGAPTTKPAPPVNPGFSLVENANSGQCFFVVNASLDPGAAIMQNTCAQVRNQQFTVSRQQDGSFLMRDANSRNCLRETGAGSIIQTAKGCSASDPSQAFLLKPVAAGVYNLVSKRTGLCTDVPGRSTVAGAQMQSKACDGGSSQAWAIAYTQ